MLQTDGDKVAAATMAAAFVKQGPDASPSEKTWVQVYFTMLDLIRAENERRQTDTFNAGQAAFRDRNL